jgi:hypothetical protein
MDDQAMKAYRKLLNSCTDDETYEVWQYLTQWVHSRVRKSQVELIAAIRDLTNTPREP